MKVYTINLINHLAFTLQIIQVKYSAPLTFQTMRLSQALQKKAGSVTVVFTRIIILAINYLLMQMPMVLAMASFANQAIEKAHPKTSV